MKKLCHPRRLLILYFVCMSLGFVFIIANPGLLCNNNSKDVDSEYRGLSSGIFRNITGLEVKLSKLESQVKAKERKLRELNTLERVRNTSINKNYDKLPTIHVITPTYSRPVQKAELTRLVQCFLHIPNLHWIVVEDSDVKTPLVTNLLANSGLNYTHINEKTPESYKLADKDPNWLKPRGVLQRNKALSWLRNNIGSPSPPGVVYFADDDNVYDLKLFDEMRDTVRVSVWPVGLVGKLRYEAPLLTNGKVMGWHTYWYPNRPFACDMAGFAINLGLILHKPDAGFKLRSRRGWMESDLLTSFGVTKDDLEPKANNCSQVLVWHTRTEKADLKNENRMKLHGLHPSDPNIEV